jgi:RNA polymerase sigma-70 factor (ECF subfamily)
MRAQCKPELIKSGDHAAIGELFERHYPSSLRVARRILRSEEESEDAVQSAYLSAFCHLDSFRGEAAFKTWISRIVMNHCLMRLRKRWAQIQWIDMDSLLTGGASSLLTCPDPNPEKSAFCQEISTAVAEASASLPAQLAEVFQLYAISGLSVKEVARATGLTLSAAKSRLFRARARVRERLCPVWSDARPRSGGKLRNDSMQMSCEICPGTA